jgi:TonB-dependent Receptor Plug Domain
MMTSDAKCLAILAVSAMGLAACQPMPRTAHGTSPQTAYGETVITEQQIAQMGAQTAWDAVRVRAPRLRYGRDANGRPTSVRIQEPRSVNADETPLVIVDGARVGDIDYLNNIPASDVHLIRIIDGEVATQLYGIDAGSGAIVVETKKGQ